MSPSPKLPNLLIIGAMKCGTTSLHEYLGRHADVSMSNPKELNFFTLQGNWHRGRSWYEAHFDEDCLIRGESSPSYTFHPYVRGVPERAAEVLSEVKLLYQVRDPIDRIVSHYVHRVTAGRERRSFAEALDGIEADLSDDVEEPAALADAPGYLARSMYLRQLERWRTEFPDSHIMVIDDDDLRTRRAETLASVARFLGIADRFDRDATTGMHNPTAAKRLVSPFGAWARRRGGVRLAQKLPEQVRRPLIRSFTRVFDEVPGRPVLTSDQHDRLAQLLQADIDGFRAYTGRPFANWSI